MATSEEVLVCLSTCPEGEAERLARLLVEERLAACVNIVPLVMSMYRWEGKINTDRESLLVIKSPRALREALIERLAAAHPYDVPEILCLPLAGGHGPYLDWVLASCGGEAGT